MCFKGRLQLDIDTKIRNKEKFIEELLDRITFFIKLYEFKFWVTKFKVLETKKGYHFYIYFVSERKIEDIEILYMQQALGDDYKRAGFNLIRVVEGDCKTEEWNVLFIDKERITDRSISFISLFFRLYQLKINLYKEQYNEFFKADKGINPEIK